ncbi:hypothetical protein AQJ46_51040 [Streptomyces canus]|uniref:Uncharacterized protein n=1 Tax=Streptomyces canus TaxID=58343 RepID=A0A117QVR9_9ACTN|nr:hypothetical protein AQJ46_51040 [Streptomyces canus]
MARSRPARSALDRDECYSASDTLFASRTAPPSASTTTSAATTEERTPTMSDIYDDGVQYGAVRDDHT